MLLYSRSNGLTIVLSFRHGTVFSFKHGSSIAHAIFSSDPFRLSIIGETKQVGRGISTASSSSSSCTTPINNIVLRQLPYGFARLDPPAGLGKLYFESNTKFYQLSVLYQDLSLSEHLLADNVLQSNPEIPIPRSLCKTKVYKTPTKVLEDFIVPDDDEDAGVQESLMTAGSNWLRGESFKTNSNSSDENTSSISLTWLERRLFKMLEQFISTDSGEFEDTLQHLNATIQSKTELEDGSMRTLYV